MPSFQLRFEKKKTQFMTGLIIRNTVINLLLFYLNLEGPYVKVKMSFHILKTVPKNNIVFSFDYLDHTDIIGTQCYGLNSCLLDFRIIKVK